MRPQKIARLRRSYSEGQSNPKIKQGKQRENSALHFALLTSNLTLRTGNEVDSRENSRDSREPLNLNGIYTI